MNAQHKPRFVKVTEHFGYKRHYHEYFKAMDGTCSVIKTEFDIYGIRKDGSRFQVILPYGPISLARAAKYYCKWLEEIFNNINGEESDAV